MIKHDKHIVIVRSSILRLSSLSLVSSAAIVNVLSKHYVKVSVATVNNLSDLEAVLDIQPDLIFMGMKYVYSDVNNQADSDARIWLADFFDAHDIAYTGSNQLAHELELDKSLAKIRVQQAGLATSKFQVIACGDEARFNPGLNFPLFVKPTNRGGGVGIDQASVVNNVNELSAKVSAIVDELRADSLVEEYLPGREFSVAILRQYDSEIYDVMPIELVAEADDKGFRMLSEAVKLSNIEQVVAVSNSKLRRAVNDLAIKVFMALGARDYGRIDIRLDAKGQPHFLEANLIPSLIDDYGSFPKASRLNLGLDHETMLMQIVELGLLRTVTAEIDETDSIIEPFIGAELLAIS